MEGKKPKGFGKFDSLMRKLIQVPPSALGENKVAAHENGHQWIVQLSPTGQKYVWCKVCCNIRRVDGTDGPCPGKPGIELRK